MIDEQKKNILLGLEKITSKAAGSEAFFTIPIPRML
jgi:hypothetical protein